MTVFLIIMIVGFTGLMIMALPGMLHHSSMPHSSSSIGHAHVHPGTSHIAHSGQGHSAPHPHAAGAGGANSGGHAAPNTGGNGSQNSAETMNMTVTTAHKINSMLPSPRVIFSTLALYGAFGYMFVAAHLLPIIPAYFAALIPALLIEKFALTPLWNLMFQFEGKPTTPLENLVMSEATAVTPFPNGKGIVALELDGRTVQFNARLLDEQKEAAVRVGDTLYVEEVDSAKQRLTVSVSRR